VIDSFDGTGEEAPVSVKSLKAKAQILPDLESEEPENNDETEQTEDQEMVAKPVITEPTVEETSIKKVLYPANQRSPLLTSSSSSNNTRSQDFVGVMPQHHNAVTQLAELVKAGAQRNMFDIEVIRKTPATYDGYKMIIGEAIERMKPMELRYIRDAITELHGGGTYAISIISKETGQEVNSIPFEVDINRCPPKIPDNAELVEDSGGRRRDYDYQGRGARMGGYRPDSSNPLGNMMAQRQAGGMPGFATLGPQNQDVVASVNAERANKAKILEIQSEMQLKEAEVRKEEAEARYEEQRLARLNRGKEDSNKTAEVMRSEMKDMFNGFKELVLTVMTNKSGKGDDTALLAKAMETSNANTIESMKSMVTLLVSMMNNQGKDTGKSQELAEAIKMTQSANERIVDMALKGNSKFDKLVEGVFLGQMNKTDDNMERMLRLMSMGREQEREAFKLAAQFNGGGSDDSDLIDPDAGFTGNLGNMLLRGISSVVGGVARGGFGKIAELVANAGAQSTYNPTVYQPQAQLPAPPAQAQLPAPQPQWQQPQPQQQQPQPHWGPPPQQPQPQPQRPDVFPDQSEEQNVVNEGANPATQSTLIGERLNDQIVDFPFQEVREQVQQQRQQQQQIDPSAEERLREYVTESMEIASEDLVDGRRDHSWSEHALGKWSKPFLDSMLNAPDDHERLKLIQSKCDPETFAKVNNQLMASKENGYTFFVALKALLNGYARAKHGLAA
jgi:hypothetical protein